MSKKLRNSLPIIIVFTGIITALSIFFDVLMDSLENPLTGIKAVFGGEVVSIGEFGGAALKFNILNSLAFFLPLITSIVVALAITKDKKTSTIKMILGLILTAVFVMSAILIFQLPQNTEATITILGINSTVNYEGSTLEIGAIVAAVSSILGAFCSFLYTTLQLTK